MSQEEMNKLEKLHLNAILEESFNQWTTWHDEQKAAQNFAKITKDVAIKFHTYYENTARLSFDSTGENQGKPIDEIFNNFLETL